LARAELRKKGLDVIPVIEGRHILKRAAARIVPGVDSSSLVSNLGQILATTLRTGIDVDALIERSSPRVSDLARVIKTYRADLLQKGFIDRSELLWWAANNRPEPRPIYIYGHFRARKEEIFFIDAIAGDTSEFILPIQPDDDAFTVNNEWAEWLRSRKWTLKKGYEGPENSYSNEGQHLASAFSGGLHFGQPPSASKYTNIEAEVRGILANAKKRILDGAKAHDIAIVSRDQDLYAPVIGSIAAEYGVPVRIRHRIKLASTMFGGFVRLVLDAFALDMAYEATARMLMHPFGMGLQPGVWARARGRRPSNRDEWILTGAPFENLIWPERQPFTLWSGLVRTVFQLADVRNKTALHTREILAFNAFNEALSELDQLEGEHPITLKEFSISINEILGESTVPYQSGAAGIELHEPNTILGAAFDHLYIVGLAESVFPAAIKENPVLDFFERKNLTKYGIDFEEAAEVAYWETLSFYFTLLAGGKSVSFSFPEVIENSERIPSPFFDRLGIKPERSAVVSVSSLEEARSILLRNDGLLDDTVANEAREHLRIESLRESASPHDEYDGVIGVRLDPASRTWSASQLTTISQCGFRWFAQRVLRLAPVEEVDLGMDYGKRGIFYHRVLELAVSRATDQPDIRAATLQHLDEAFAETESDPEIELPMISNWQLQRSEHLRAIRKAIEAPDFISEGAKVLGLEQKFEADWKGLKIMGYIDRVDQTPDGLIAIDYKTSSVMPKGAKDETGKLSIDVQIPLYSNVALRQLYPDGDLGNSVYYSLTKGKKLRSEKPGDFEKLENLIDNLKLLMESGSYAVAPDIDEGACTYCEFELLCRKGPRLERKGIKE
jgi:RecB family exonuclease